MRQNDRTSVEGLASFATDMPTVLFGLLSVFMLAVVAGGWGLSILPFFVLAVLALLHPKAYIYLSIFLVSFIHVLSEPNYIVNLPNQSLTLLQVNPAGSAFYQNFDEAVLVGALMILMRRLIHLKAIRIPYFKGWVGLSITAICVSWVANGLSPVILANYLSSYLRLPIMLMAFLAIPDWTRKDLDKLANVILILCLPIQFVFGILQNIGTLLTGRIILSDGLSGTFNFPIGDWSTMYVTLGMIYMLCHLVTRYQVKHAVWFLLGILYLVSAEENLSTIVAIATFGLVIAYFTLVEQVPSKARMKRVAKLSIAFGTFAIVLVLIGELITSFVDPEISYRLTQYIGAKLAQQNAVLGISPKILTYLNLLGLYLSGTVNVLWGAGPAMYLSGLALYNFGGVLTQEYSTEAQIEWLFNGVGRGDAMENNVVAFAGEIGIIGLLGMYMPLLAIVTYLGKNIAIIKHTETGIRIHWTVFAVIFFLLYSTLLLVFEIQPLIFVLAILCGIGIKYIEIFKREGEFGISRSY
jgi:hypothetical protein